MPGPDLGIKRIDSTGLNCDQNVIRSESRLREICLAKLPTRLFDNVGFHGDLLFLLRQSRLHPSLLGSRGE
jgi:hypothetical protein